MAKPTSRRIRFRRGDRRGGTLVFVAFLIVVIVAMVAFSVDVGRMHVLRCQIQTAVDSGALAASLKLAGDPDAITDAQAAAKQFVQANRVGTLVTVPENAITVEVGQWDPDTKTFVAGQTDPNAVRVYGQMDNEPFSFGQVLGHQFYSAPASGIASGAGGPLDIMMVLDLSGSMGDSGRIEALRNAAPEFVNVIESFDGEDQIGVMGYGVEDDEFDSDDHGNGTPYTTATASLYPGSDADWVGVVEGELTTNFNSLRNNVLSSSNLVASKYGGGTPIGAGLRDSAHYLKNSPLARTTVNNVPVKKVIVLMSDGYANKPSGSGGSYALTMADYAATEKIQVYTISLGNSADLNLMEQIASRTNATHFDATGSGASVLTAALTTAFRRVATAIKRPQIVQ